MTGTSRSPFAARPAAEHLPHAGYLARVIRRERTLAAVLWLALLAVLYAVSG